VAADAELSIYFPGSKRGRPPGRARDETLAFMAACVGREGEFTEALLRWRRFAAVPLAF
jgi:hypothetical protein